MTDSTDTPEPDETLRTFVRELFAETPDDAIWQSPDTEESTEGK